jgi:hypothetical protein
MPDTAKSDLPVAKPAPKEEAPVEDPAVAEALAKVAEVHSADYEQQAAAAVAGLPTVPADHLTPGYIPEPDVEEGTRSASAPAPKEAAKVEPTK